MKYIAVLFSIFIIAVVILADRGSLPHFIRAIYDFPNGDKVGHFVLFGLLNFLVTGAILSSRHSVSRLRSTISIGLILALLITAEELSQKWFSTRTFDLVDLSASCLGLFVGGLAAFQRRFSRTLIS